MGGDVLMEEQLGDGLTVLREVLVIDEHQLTLSHRSGGLFFLHDTRSFTHAQFCHTGAHSARGHKNDLLAHILDVAEDHGDPVNLAEVDPAAGMGQRTRADFDYDSFDVRKFFHVLSSFLGCVNRTVREILSVQEGCKKSAIHAGFLTVYHGKGQM